MFVPLYDHNPLRVIPAAYATWLLIATNVVVFIVFQSGLFYQSEDVAVVVFGMIPAVVHHTAVLPDELAFLPAPVTLVTYMFLHGGWMHLLSNMLFLWVFGDNVEDALGHGRFVVFYLLCGIAAGAAHAALIPASTEPLVGASGAVAGVIAAYVMLHPRVKLWVLLMMRIPLKISAMWVIGAWFLLQIGYALFGTDQTTAWWAHVGGFLAGALLIVVLRPAGVPLFDRGLSQQQVR
jgi:membrane associated rhomboid family serine protease